MKARLLDKSVTFLKENITELVRNNTGLDFAKHKFTACFFEEEMKLNFKIIFLKKTKTQKRPACRYTLSHVYLA